jgi:hypothetical protein
MKISNLAFVIGVFLITIFKTQVNEVYHYHPYLGQTPPGITPEIFAPGIISTKYRVYANVTFNPEVKEVYWTPC